MKTYDVIVIGTGTAGQTAAANLAAAAGIRVAVAEASPTPGGVCALKGCQAKKWFYEVAETVARCRALHAIGITTLPQVDWGQILAEKNSFTSQVPDRTRRRLAKRGIDYLEGWASFVDESTLRVGDRSFQPRYVVVATGSRPMSLPLPGAEHLATSDRFLELPALPPRLALIGGGFISFEFAHYAARLGGSPGHIHILETQERPLASFDGDMVDQLVRASGEEGIEVHTGVTVAAIERQGGTFIVNFAAGEPLEVDLVVNGAGRIADIDRLDLAAAGVAHSAKGIEVDRLMRTSNPRIFAVGDCVASPQLARLADLEAKTAARAILAADGGAEPAGLDYGAVPAVLFTYPQLAMVGKTEERLKEERIPYRASFAKDLDWATFRRIGMSHAAYKILAGEDGRILGAHFLADQTSGVIDIFKQAMMDGLTVAELYERNILSPYPSRESDVVYMLRPLLQRAG